jgi:hypothetical protein
VSLPEAGSLSLSLGGYAELSGSREGPVARLAGSPRWGATSAEGSSRGIGRRDTGSKHTGWEGLDTRWGLEVTSAVDVNGEDG